MPPEDNVTPNNASHHHRVVVVGGGFGGLPATRLLRRAGVRVTLVDRTNHHLFQPLLYQVATGMMSAGEIAPPLRHLLHHQRNVTVELATVTGFDLDRRTVTATRPQGDEIEFPYDSLIVAAGANQSYFGNDEWRQHAPGMKSLDDALDMRGRLFGAFEVAETESDPEARESWLTFCVVGAGPTGVEIAGQVAELARGTLGNEFRSINPRSARVVLIDAGPEILATFGDRLSEKATAELERLGVEIRLGARVTGVDKTGIEVTTDDKTERIEARTKIWAAGVQASDLAEALADAAGASLDRAGRIEVLPDCTLPGHPEVFAIGDMMSLERLPGVAEVAIQQGIFAARTIQHRLLGKEFKDHFTYRDLGSMAMIAKYHAVVSVRGIRLSGMPGYLTWLAVHLTFLTGFRNRLAALVQWTIAMFSKGRPERAITRPPV